jgi:LEA14-like dessication related protein
MKKMLLPLLAATFLWGCGKVQEPEFRRVGNFKVKNIGLQQATIGLKVTYFNPNGFGVTVKETEADVYLDSTYLGKFYQDSTIAVSKAAEFSIPLTGTISMQTALKMDFQNLAEKEILLKAEGSTKVGKAGIFVNKPIHYQGRHRLEDVKF